LPDAPLESVAADADAAAAAALLASNSARRHNYV